MENQRDDHTSQHWAVNSSQASGSRGLHHGPRDDSESGTPVHHSTTSRTSSPYPAAFASTSSHFPIASEGHELPPLSEGEPSAAYHAQYGQHAPLWGGGPLNPYPNSHLPEDAVYTQSMIELGGPQQPFAIYGQTPGYSTGHSDVPNVLHPFPYSAPETSTSAPGSIHGYSHVPTQPYLPPFDQAGPSSITLPAVPRMMQPHPYQRFRSLPAPVPEMYPRRGPVRVLKKENLPSVTSRPPTHEETEQYLRAELRSMNVHIPDHIPLDLNALEDPVDRNAKPSYDMGVLLKLAIWGSERHMLLLSEIKDAIASRFEWYAAPENDSWKESIRHKLSLKSIFVQCKRGVDSPGRGSYWAIDIRGGHNEARARKKNRRNPT